MTPCAEAAGKACAAFTGDPDLINEAKALLLHRSELNDSHHPRARAAARSTRAEGPMTNPKLVNDRIAAEVAQAFHPQRLRVQAERKSRSP